MFQLRILLLAAAIMAWLVQPVYADVSAGSTASTSLVRLAADLVSTAALVETVDKSIGCQNRSLSKHRAQPDSSGSGVASSRSVNKIVARVTQDLPSLYLSASVTSVLDAIKPVIAELRTRTETDRQTRISCREAQIRHKRDYARLLDDWDYSLRALRELPGADVRLIAQLDAGLIGSSSGDKQRVFARIDALGAKVAGEFGRKLVEQPNTGKSLSPLAPERAPGTRSNQRYF